MSILKVYIYNGTTDLDMHIIQREYEALITGSNDKDKQIQALEKELTFRTTQCHGTTTACGILIREKRELNERIKQLEDVIAKAKKELGVGHSY